MEIRIKHFAGETLINLHKNKTIRDLKRKFKKSLSLHENDIVKIMFDDKQIINEDATLSDFNLKDGSIVKAIIHLHRSAITITIQMEGMDNICLKVDTKDTILELKKQLQQYYPLYPKDLTLTFEGHLLEDDKTMSSYNILDKSTIMCFEHLKSELLSFSVYIDNHKHNVEMKNETLLSDLKLRIQRDFDIKCDNQIILFDGKEILNEDSLRSFRISNDSNIIVKRSTITITAQMEGMDNICVKIDIKNTILELKKQIQHRCPLYPKNLSLTSEGLLLEDDKTISSYNIIDKSTIWCFEHLKSALLSFWVYIDKQKYKVKMENETLLSDLKLRIQRDFDIKCNNQFISFSGKKLLDEDTLRNYRIKNDSKIIVKRIKITVYVSVREYKDRKLEVFDKVKIKTLKEEIYRLTSIDIIKQELLYKRQILSDEQTLLQSGIIHGECINVVSLPKAYLIINVIICAVILLLLDILYRL